MKFKDNIPRKDFLDHINTTWTKPSDQFWINMYNNCIYEEFGKSIGIYRYNKLIGFDYYHEDIEKPWWFDKLQKENMVSTEYNNFWISEFLDINPNYRFKGLGSKLLQEVYNRMPNGYVLITESEHTDKHISFYKKNGFIQDTLHESNMNHYLFYRIK
jgi:GNAT superfamily N-acetyltransferase